MNICQIVHFRSHLKSRFLSFIQIEKGPPRRGFKHIFFKEIAKLWYLLMQQKLEPLWNKFLELLLIRNYSSIREKTPEKNKHISAAFNIKKKTAKILKNLILKYL